MKVNHDTVPLESLGARLKGIYSQRYRRILLVRADPNVNFDEVMQVIYEAQGGVSDMQLVVLTPKAEKTAPSCLLAQGFNKMY